MNCVLRSLKMSERPSQSFSFTWKITNFPNCYQQNGTEITSPSFTAECLGGSLWYLEVYPRGINEENVDFISCFLTRDGECLFHRIITVDYTLQITASNGEILESFQEKNKDFNQGDSDGCEKLVEFNEIIKKLKELNEDTLTIKSIISLGAQMKMATACTARSEINIDRYNFKWVLKYYAYENPKIPIQEKVFNLGALQFKIVMQSIMGNIIINIILMDGIKEVPCLLACQISFLNQKGLPDPAFYGTYLFQFDKKVWTVPHLITIDQLESSGSINKTDEILPIIFDFSCSNNVVPDTIPIYTNDTSSNTDSLSVLQSDFRELFVTKKHADVIFRVDNQELKVHKTILIARSSVFSTMFDQNMIENRTGVVDITDVELDTMKSFLEYLYMGTVVNLNYEKALKLFTVAEKYQIQSLVNECYTFLLTRLSQQNVCELIYVADIVNHASLKTAAMNYIAIHTKEVLNSPEWSQWSENNLKLTSEIFLHIASMCDITLKKSASGQLI